MKKVMLVLALIVTVSCQQDKIAYVDNLKLIDGYQEKKDVESKFQAKAEAFTKKKDSISQAFQLELQQLQASAQSMSKKKAEEQYGLMQQRGQFIGQQLQQEEQAIQQEGQTALDSVLSKIKREVKAYGKAQGYTYILGGGDGGSVLYGDEAKDLTDQVLKVLNDKYGN